MNYKCFYYTSLKNTIVQILIVIPVRPHVVIIATDVMHKSCTIHPSEARGLTPILLLEFVLSNHSFLIFSLFHWCYLEPPELNINVSFFLMKLKLDYF